MTQPPSQPGVLVARDRPPDKPYGSDVVNVYEAKTHFSRLLKRVEQGEHVVIARAGKPVALLTPVGRSSIFQRLPPQPGAVTGDPEDLVALDWSSEWNPDAP